MLKALIFDDPVVGPNPPPTSAQLHEALALMETICGPLQMTCVTHGPDCEMRRRTCNILSRHDNKGAVPLVG